MPENREEERSPPTLRVTDRARALVHVNVKDVIFYLHVENDRFRFAEINPAFTRATGLAEERVVGKLVDDVIPEPSLSIVLARYRQAITERRTVRWEEVTEYPTGRKYGEVSITPLLDAEGRCTTLIGTVHDVTEAHEHAETIRLYAEIVRSVQIGMMVWKVEESASPSAITLAAINPAAERITGERTGTRHGCALSDVFCAAEDEPLAKLVCKVAETGGVHELSEHRFAERPDVLQVFRIKAFPLPGTGVGLAIEDVSAEARARAILSAEQQVLEMVASGVSLKDTLTTLVLRVEELAPPAIASVLLLTADGKRVTHGAAPNLPEDYNHALEGAAIGPNAGSCGTAAALGETVIVTDVRSDKRWEAYRDLAERFTLRACWSTPIKASGGRVLGTFALYYREPRAPTRQDLHLIARAVHVAGIAIERHELDEQLRALSARLEAAREDERTGIAREIHDRLGQTLTVLKLDLAWIARRVAANGSITPDVLLDKVKDLTRSTDELIEDVRRISAELRPGMLDDVGLGAALSWKAQELEKRTNIACSVKARVEDRTLSRYVATAVYRIAEEALTNVVRHSGASHVEVRLDRADGSLVLEVRDDGNGIPEERIDDPHSLGLLGIRERARSLGGSASFGRLEPTGTVVTVRLPLAPAS